MTLLRFACGICGKMLGAPPETAGQVITCPGCGGQVVAPGEVMEAIPATDEPIKVRCGGCNAVRSFPAGAAGVTVLCPGCRAKIVVPASGDPPGAKVMTFTDALPEAEVEEPAADETDDEEDDGPSPQEIGKRRNADDIRKRVRRRLILVVILFIGCCIAVPLACQRVLEGRRAAEQKLALLPERR